MGGLRTPLIIVVALCAALLGACGGDDGESGGDETANGDELAQKAERQDQCQTVTPAEAKDVSLEAPKPLEPKRGIATFVTNCGRFSISFDTERAPKTSASVQYLISEGVYDGTAFHRVAPGFVVQAGDPAGDGTGGPGYSIDEPPPDDLSYTRGIVAMAKTGAEPPGRSGSQFFVVTAADAGLPPQYALVGELEDGLETIRRIEAQATPGSDGPPDQAVVIERATFEPDS